MKIVFGLIAIIGATANIYYHYHYALANYPKSKQWHIKIFATAFIAGSMGFLALPSSVGLIECLFAVGGGILLAIVSLFLFPHNIQYIIPKR